MFRRHVSDTLELPDTIPDTSLDTCSWFLKILYKAGVAHHNSGTQDPLRWPPHSILATQVASVALPLAGVRRPMEADLLRECELRGRLVSGRCFCVLCVLCFVCCVVVLLCVCVFVCVCFCCVRVLICCCCVVCLLLCVFVVVCVCVFCVLCVFVFLSNNLGQHPVSKLVLGAWAPMSEHLWTNFTRQRSPVKVTSRNHLIEARVGHDLHQKFNQI